MASQESDSEAQNLKETDPLLGQTVGGRFVIKGRIARGGMACVYSAVQTHVERPVAIKVMRPTLDGAVGSDADFRRRFLQEASILSRLQHPNLVTLLDYGQITEASGEHYYIAMEYLRGETLSRRFRNRGRLDVAQTIRIARQVGRGLRAAHRQGFVHRDLKPSNIMLVPEDAENDIVKLIDFGIGKAVGSRALEPLRDASDSEEMTRVGLLLGSPRYMAPEQIRGDTVEPRTDLYGLGIVLYQALTGRLPFEGKSQMDLMLAHCSQPPPPLDDFLELPAPSLSELVADLLKKHPSERPTIDEFLARLANVEQDLFDSVGLAGPTLHSTRSSFPPPDGRGSLRPPPPASGRRSSSPSRLPAPPAPPRRSRSDNATVVVTGSLASTPSLAAPKPADPSLLLAPSSASEEQIVPPALHSSRTHATSLEPYLAPPQAVPGPRGKRKKWALLLVPLFGGLLWLSLRPTPELLPAAPPAVSAAVPAPPTSFILRLDSSPSAAVVKEGDAVLGQTPLRLVIDRASLGSGPRLFSVERDGYSSYTHQQGDSTSDVDVVAQLSRAPNAISAQSRPRFHAKPAVSGEVPAAPAVVAAPANAKPTRGLDINLER